MGKLERAAKAIRVPDSAAAKLVWFFRRNGYVRRASRQRREAEGSRVYKKGDEVRLVASSREELATIRRLLKAAGFKAGRPFRKARQYRQPVYGRDQVARFLALVRTRSKSLRAQRAKVRRGA